MLASLAVLALLVCVALPIFGQLVQRWRGGEAAIADADLWMQVTARLSDDLMTAVPIVAGDGPGATVAFRASPTAVTFVRPALGSADTGGLEVVTVSIVAVKDGERLQRAAMPYDPERFANAESRPGVTLIEGPYRLRFASIDADGRRLDQWRDTGALPARLELAMRATGRRAVPGTSLALPIAARRGGPVEGSAK